MATGWRADPLGLGFWRIGQGVASPARAGLASSGGTGDQGGPAGPAGPALALLLRTTRAPEHRSQNGDKAARECPRPRLW